MRMGRRTGGYFAVLVIDAPMAGTHEELGIGLPPHRAAEVCAVDGEGFEGLFIHAT